MITLDRVPLRRGQQLLLGVTEGGAQDWHASRVLLREQTLVWVECSEQLASRLSGARGAEVLMDTWRVMDARYRLRARIRGVELESEPSLELELIEGTRIQHREYFRVSVSINPEVAVVETGEQDRPISLHLRDLSAGGVRARCASMLSVADVLSMSIQLPRCESPLLLRARVARVVEELGPSDYPCEVGAAFIDLPADAREQIIRFALQIQAEELRREAVG